MSTHVIEYNVSDAAIEQLGEELSGLTAETPEKYKAVAAGIGRVRTLRVAVEKTRKELKADALAYGRKVDGEAKRITAKLLEIEEPLKLTKQAVDDEKARIKREKEEAERKAREAEEARLRAEQEAKERAERERIKAEQEAEQKRLDAERAELEKQRLAQEAELRKQREAEQERQRIAQEKADAERKAEEEKLRVEREKIEAQQREEQARIEAERKKVEAERLRLEHEKFEREAKERAEREAKEKAEREAEEKRLAEIEAKKEQERLLAMRPDVEKVAAIADAISAIEMPIVLSDEANTFLLDIRHELLNIAEEAQDWATNHAAKELVSQ